MRCGKLLAAILVTLCIGVQVLEATGRWDRTIQDTGDEVVLVTVVLCIGAALGTAGRILLRVRLSPTRTHLPLVRTIQRISATAPSLALSSSASPPLPLRI